MKDGMMRRGVLSATLKSG